MMNKRIAEGFIVSFLLVLSLFFTSCSHINSASEDMLGVPVTADSMERILDAVYEFCGEDAELVYPLGGKNINPVSFYDIDGNGSDEVLVFYRSLSDGVSGDGLARLSVFADDGESLSLLLDLQTGWYDISKFELSDLDGDGISELVVGCQNLDTEKRLGVYSFSPDLTSYTRLRHDQYTDWVITDINNDGLKDVVLIYNNTVQKSAFAIAYKPGCGETENILDYAALGVGGEFYRMTDAVDSEGKNYIIISSKHETMLSSVEILCWDPVSRSVVNVSYSLGKFENPFITVEDSGYNVGKSGVMTSVDASSKASEPTEVIQSPVDNLFYNFCTYGRYVPSDVTGDGLVEFPMYYDLNESDLQHSMSLGKEKIKYRYSWYQFETDLGNYIESDCYRSIYHNYLFNVNDNWDRNRIFVYESNSSFCNFYYIPETDGSEKESAASKTVLLFRIRATQAEVEVNANIIPLAVSEGFNFYIEINPNISEEYRKFIPSAKEFKASFVNDFRPNMINVFDSYISDYHNYIFIIDEFWNFNDISVFESYNRDLIFYYVAEPDYLFTENSEMKIRLFTVKTSAESVAQSRYVVPLAHMNNLYYYAEINPDVPLKYKNLIPAAESLKRSFVPAMISAAE